MTTEHDTHEFDELEALLPWYATSKLDDADRRRVEAALKSDPNLQAQLALIEEDQGETILLNEALGMPSAGLVNKLMARIEAEAPAPSAAAKAGRGLIEWIGEFVTSLTPRQVGYAAVAAALLVVIQASVITGQMVDGNGAKYKTASHGKLVAAAKPHVLVGFNSTADLGSIEKLLAAHGARIVDGPLAGGNYKIHLKAKAGQKPDVAGVIAELKKHGDIVRMALPLTK